MPGTLGAASSTSSWGLWLAISPWALAMAAEPPEWTKPQLSRVVDEAPCGYWRSEEDGNALNSSV